MVIERLSSSDAKILATLRARYWECPDCESVKDIDEDRLKEEAEHGNVLRDGCDSGMIMKDSKQDPHAH